MERFEQTGKSVEDALRAVEERIGRPLRQEEYQIVDVGSRGVLGLIGAKPAVLAVWLREGAGPVGSSDSAAVEEWAVSSAELLLRHMGLGAHATASIQDDCLQVDLEMSDEDGGILIGRRGATLDAFQHVVRRMVERQAGEPVAVVVDVGGYRERRREALVQKALRIADQVKRSGRQVTMDPMPPGERRAVHMALKPDRGITTYSVGQEPDRKVVIAAAEGGRQRQRRRPEREHGDRPRDAAPVEREFPRHDADEDMENHESFSMPSDRPSAIEEVAPPETMVYGRRRLYRKARNRPTKPVNNGLDSQ
ncbi:KH domain-containing protein [Candidatus Fermentibacteria bacterium]|nr:KH domain-containing protein [Candidatus Fermentibacteria bacterium]